MVAGRVPHHSHFLLNLLENGAIPAVQVDDLDEQGLGFRVWGLGIYGGGSSRDSTVWL